MTEEDLVKTLLVRAIDERDPSLFSNEQVESAESEAGDVTGGAQWVQRRADCLFAFIPEELRLAARVPRISLKALLFASVPAFAVGVAPNVPGFLKAAGILHGPRGFFDEVYVYAWFTGFLLAAIVYLMGMRGRTR